MQFNWEEIYDAGEDNFDVTKRAKVFGGWIVQHFVLELGSPPAPCISLTFIPDPNHEWVIDDEVKDM